MSVTDGIGSPRSDVHTGRTRKSGKPSIAVRRFMLAQAFDTHPIVLRARTHGCTIETPQLSVLTHLMQNGMQKTYLPVNGVRCRLHRLTRVLKKQLPGHQKYTDTTFMYCRTFNATVQVLHVLVPGYDEAFYVVPSKVVRTKLFPEDLEEDSRKLAALSIPLLDRPVPRANVHFDIVPFKDRWDLIVPDSGSAP